MPAGAFKSNGQLRAMSMSGLNVTDLAAQDKEYVEACMHPGRKRVIPPFSNGTEIAGVIPLALEASVYTSRGQFVA